MKISKLKPISEVQSVESWSKPGTCKSKLVSDISSDNRWFNLGTFKLKPVFEV